MDNKTTRRRRRSRSPKRTTLWNMYQQLGQFATAINNLPDAAALRERPQYSAPLPFLNVVF